MADRRTLLSPFQISALYALGLFANLPPVLEQCREIDVDSLFYSTMIQGGVEAFDVPKIEGYSAVSSEFISKKLDRGRAKLSC